MQNNTSKLGKIIFVILVLLVIVSIVYGKLQKDKSITPLDQVQTNKLQVGTSVEKDIIKQDKVINKSSYLETKSIRLLNPLDGQIIEAGSVFDVKYELKTDSSLDDRHLLLVGVENGNFAGDNCLNVIRETKKGIYSFSCKISQMVGERNFSISELIVDQKTGLKDEQKSQGSITVIVPKGTIPQEIVFYPEEFYTQVSKPSDTYFMSISLEVLFSDGIKRKIPINEITYYFDDPSIAYVSSSKNSSLYIGGYKEGNTILHITYKSIKTSVPIGVYPRDTSLDN